MGTRFFEYSGEWERSQGAQGICFAVAFSNIVNYHRWPQTLAFSKFENNAWSEVSLSPDYTLINGPNNTDIYYYSDNMKNGIGYLLKTVEYGHHVGVVQYPMYLESRGADVLRNRFGYPNAEFVEMATNLYMQPEIEERMRYWLTDMKMPIIQMESGHMWVIDEFQDKNSEVASYERDQVNLDNIKVYFTDGSSQVVTREYASQQKLIRTYHQINFSYISAGPMYGTYFGRFKPLLDPSMATYLVFPGDLSLQQCYCNTPCAYYRFGNKYQYLTSSTTRRGTIHLFNVDGREVAFNLRVVVCDINNNEISTKLHLPFSIPPNGSQSTPEFSFTVDPDVNGGTIIKAEFSSLQNNGYGTNCMKFSHNDVVKGSITLDGNLVVSSAQQGSLSGLVFRPLSGPGGYALTTEGQWNYESGSLNTIHQSKLHGTEGLIFREGTGAWTLAMLRQESGDNEQYIRGKVNGYGIRLYYQDNVN